MQKDRNISVSENFFSILIGRCLHGNAYFSMTRQIPWSNADTLHIGSLEFFLYSLDYPAAPYFAWPRPSALDLRISKDLIPPIPSFPIRDQTAQSEHA